MVRLPVREPRQPVCLVLLLRSAFLSALTYSPSSRRAGRAKCFVFAIYMRHSPSAIRQENWQTEGHREKVMRYLYTVRGKIEC
ncbi:hypothetical protein FA95DRAFT_1030667 [Auriscalpium vulgare]|uniref:Uncharacterized protein n=1 Tax=Auriscalpium vulgare TaxID=40419 RepID=A0ACB8R6Y6_9AGAM|nr:hypothetical protein FA95DRAFT_1030667 [Auriscalpium vulgare]